MNVLMGHRPVHDVEYSAARCCEITGACNG